MQEERQTELSVPMDSPLRGGGNSWLAPGGPEPLYARIYRDLKARIESGVLPTGSKLPSQRVLSQEYDVTLMTLRQALGLLKQEGLIVTRQGSGTSVAPRRFAYSIGPLHSLAQEIAQQGLQMTTSVLECALERAPSYVVKKLGLRRSAKVLRLDRLRRVEGEIVVYQHSYMPAWIGRAVLRHDLASRSLYDVLAEDLGFKIERADEQIHPILLSHKEARLLEVKPRTAAMLSVRTTFTTGARPILHDRAYLPGDRLMIVAERRHDDVALRYVLRAVDAPPEQGSTDHLPTRRLA